MTKHDFPRIEQVDANMCGPACVEMMLEYLGVRGVISKGSAKSLQEKIVTFSDQAVENTIFYTNLNDKADPWSSFATRPIEIVNMFQAIAKEVNDEKKKELLSELWMNYFSQNAVGAGGWSSKDKVSDFLAHLEQKINDANHPPLIIPVHEASHWVVLYDVTVKPRKNGKGLEFKGKDPIQYSKGTKKSPNAGIITISDSYLNFDNPVNLVCIEVIPAQLNVESRKRAPVLGPILPSPVRLPSTPVPPATISNLVKQVLDIVPGNNEFNAVTRQASSPKLGQPLLVHRLDRPNYDYYLVPVLNGENEVTQLIRMDALTGDFLDSLQIDPTALFFDINADDPGIQGARRASSLKPSDLPQVGQSNLNEQANVTPNLVWKPSVQSLSAFYPLHQISPESFLRIDGKKFTGPLVPVKWEKQVSNT